MFAIHSDSEAQWNNHGPLVDQDESPHIQPNHLDPMELAAQCNAPWLRKGDASLDAVGDPSGAYIYGHTHKQT